MKQRSVMAVILLSIITFGIYDLFWLVKTKKVLNEKTNVHTPSIWLLFAPTIVMIAAIVVILVAGAASSTGDSGTSGNAGASVVVLIVDLLALVVIVPITFYWFFKFSKAVSVYTNGEMNTAMTFLLLWLLRFVGIAIIQDKFNDMATAGTGTIGQVPQDAAYAAPVAITPPVSPVQPQTPAPDAFAQPNPAAAPAPTSDPIVPATPAPELSAAPQTEPSANPSDQSNDQPQPPISPVA